MKAWPWAAAALMALAAWSCTAAPGKLTVTATAESAPADGTPVQLLLEATDLSGAPGAGEVELKISHGGFVGAKSSASKALAEGKASIAVYCMESEDPQCDGEQIVRAKWGEYTAYVTLTFVGKPRPPADAGQGEPDAGAGADAGDQPEPPDAGAEDAGQ